MRASRGSHRETEREMAKRIGATIGAIAVIAGLLFGVSTYETKFATADELNQVVRDVVALSKRLENKIQEDRLHAIQQRVWALEDRYGGINVPDAPAEVCDGYREQKYEAEMLKQTIRGNN